MSDEVNEGPTTVQQVSAVVAVIAGQVSGGLVDSERLHAAEDVLYVAVLKSIADGTADDPAAMAREALKVNDMDFARWYA